MYSTQSTFHRIAFPCRRKLPKGSKASDVHNFYKPSHYGQSVVFVANDWHTALLGPILRTKYKPHGVYEDATVVQVLHNIAYQVRGYSKVGVIANGCNP